MSDSLLSSFLGPEREAMARGAAAGVVRSVYARLGRFHPIPPEEKALKLEKTIRFKGDKPIQIKGADNIQGRMVFRNNRPLMEEVDRLVVTPLGGAWRDNQFYERYSTRAPGLRLLTENARPEKKVAYGYVIQSAHADTYGDWVSEYLGALARVERLDAPLYLPSFLTARAYAARDLAQLGVSYAPIDKPVLIEKAKVLRQQKHFVHFTPDEAAGLKKFWRPGPPSPAPGGVVYFSRHGEASEVAQRTYPSRLVEDIVAARGGHVLRTANASRETYDAAAPFAETLIFDHGSALYNAINWPVKRVVEIISDQWWNNAFLMMADALGINDYTIIRGDLGDAHVQALLAKTLDQPLDVSCAT